MKILKKIWIWIVLVILCVIIVFLLHIITNEDAEISTAENAVLKAQQMYAVVMNDSEESVEDTEETNPAYEALFSTMREVSEDYTCWIRINSIGFSMPVCQADSSQPNFWLNYDFFGEKNYLGTPFILYNQSVDTDFFSIWAHHLYNNEMFSQLDVFTDSDFEPYRKKITITTETETRTYSVFAVARMSASDSDFVWNTTSDFENRREFEQFLKIIKNNNEIENVSYPEYGTQILMLATCEYSHNDGRLLIFASRIEE